jgi:hypothetical protein
VFREFRFTFFGADTCGQRDICGKMYGHVDDDTRLRDMSFWWRSVPRLGPFEICRRVVWCIGNKLAEKPAASIFRLVFHLEDGENMLLRKRVQPPARLRWSAAQNTTICKILTVHTSNLIDQLDSMACDSRQWLILFSATIYFEPQRFGKWLHFFLQMRRWSKKPTLSEMIPYFISSPDERNGTSFRNVIIWKVLWTMQRMQHISQNEWWTTSSLSLRYFSILRYDYDAK